MAARSRGAALLLLPACAAAAWLSGASHAGETGKADRPQSYVKKATWHETMLASREAAMREAGVAKEKMPVPLPDFGKDPFTISAWIRTVKGGTIFAKAPPKGEWVPQGRSLYVRGGKLHYDVGFVGCLKSKRRVGDGKWHHVAVAAKPPRIRFYIDGAKDNSRALASEPDVRGHVVKIGHTVEGFDDAGSWRGDVDEVRVYGRVLSEDEVKTLFGKPEADGIAGLISGLVARWPFDGDGMDATGGRNHAAAAGNVEYVEGRAGKALHLGGGGHMTVQVVPGGRRAAGLWARIGNDFPDEASRREMAWEREDGIWRADWKPATSRTSPAATPAPRTGRRRSPGRRRSLRDASRTVVASSNCGGCISARAGARSSSRD